MALACLCSGTSDRKVVKAISRGASDVAAIGAACGAGTCCGGCHDRLRALLAEHAPSRSTEASASASGPATMRTALA